MPEQIDTSIYSKLNQNNSGGFGQWTPQQVMDLANKQIEFNTRNAIGQALRNNQDSRSPSGVNVPNALKEVLSNPNARLAPEDVGAFSQADTTGIARQSAGTNLDLAVSGAMNDFLGTVSTIPNLDRKTFDNMLLAHSARHPWIPDAKYDEIRKNAPQKDSDLVPWLTARGNMARGAGTTMGGTPIVTESGRTLQVPEGSAAFARRGGGTTSALPAGTPETLAQSAQDSGHLFAAQEQAPQQVAMLNQLKDLSHTAASGPTSDVEKQLNAFSQRWAGTGITLTKEQLADTEEFDKIAHQIAGQQATAAHATDAYLTNAYGANPSSKLSVLGRDGIIAMLTGNAKIPAVKWNSWLAYKNGDIDGRPHDDNEYRQFSANFNKQLDPRVFQFMEMNADQQKRFLGMITSKEDRARFAKGLIQAQRNGWISSPNAQP